MPKLSLWYMDWLSNGGVLTYLLMLCPGPSDVASLCSAENHFRWLGYGVEETDLLPRLWGEPDALAQPTPRRGTLDRLLAVRLAASRGYRSALPALRKITATDGGDPILRRAALEAIALLEGQPTPAVGPGTRTRRRGVGSPADELRVHRRLPLRRHARHARLAAKGGRSIQAMARRGAIELAEGRLAPALPNTVRMMHISCMIGEGPYEVARVFGNARLRRLVAGFSANPHPEGLVVVDGLFSPTSISAGLEREGIEHELQDGVLSAQLAMVSFSS